MLRFLLGMNGLLDLNTDQGGGGGSAEKESASGVSLEQVHEIVNGAMGKFKTTVIKDVEKMLVTTVTGEESPIMKVLNDVTGKVESLTKETAKGSKTTKTNQDSDKDDDLPPRRREEFDGMKKQNDILQKRLDEMDAKEKATAKKALDDSRRSKIQEFLDKSGFASRAKYVLASQWNDIQWEDDTSVDLQNAKIRGDDGQELSYKDYIEKHYVKSDEGKDLLKVSPKFGSGSETGESTESGSPPVTLSEEDINKEFDRLVG